MRMTEKSAEALDACGHRAGVWSNELNATLAAMAAASPETAAYWRRWWLPLAFEGLARVAVDGAAVLEASNDRREVWQ